MMRHNKLETVVQWLAMSRAVFARFSGHSNSIYNADEDFTNILITNDFFKKKGLFLHFRCKMTEIFKQILPFSGEKHGLG